MASLFFGTPSRLDPLWLFRQIRPAAEISAWEIEMKSRLAVRLRSGKRPDFVFAILIVFVILLIGLVRAIDVLTAHQGAFHGGGVLG
jgi:hypothetical protein